MVYVSHKYIPRRVHDPSSRDVDHSVFMKCDWTRYYWNVKEAVIMKAPAQRWKEVDICIFVDSDHAVDKKLCRSRSDFLIYVNTDLVQWYLKKQSTVETSVFGAMFVAVKQGIYALSGLRY